MVAAEIEKTQETFFSELPIGWRYDRLKDVVSLRNDKTSDKSSEENYLELEDIEQGTGNLLSKKNTLDVESAVIRFKKGDVLFGKLRPYLEKYYHADFDGKCTGEILAFYPRGIKGHFLRYCVAAPWFIGKCNALAYGAKMPRVNWPKQLALFDIPIPPINEQHRISSYLDKTCAAIDKAIKAKQKQLGILDALRKSIIHKAVTRGLDDSVELKDSGVEWLGRIPSTWHSRRIKDVAKLSPGFSVGKPTMTDLCTVIPMEAVSESGEISTDQVQEFNSISGGLTNFEVGDIIFAKITPCMENGKGAYIIALPTKYAFGSTEFHVLRPSDKVDGKFLYYYTFNSVYRKYAEKNMTGAAGQKRVSSNFLKYTRIYLPDVMTQRHIADYLDEKCSELIELQATIVTQLSTLEQYRKSLIHECVTGKRRITEEDVRDQ